MGGVPPQTFRNKKNNQHNNQEDDDDEDEDYKFDENRQNDLEHNEANIINSMGFKEMDMETIGDFRYADDEFKEHDFKDPDDNLSGPLQRLTTQALSLAAAAAAGSGKVAGEGRSGPALPPGEDHDLF